MQKVMMGYTLSVVHVERNDIRNWQQMSYYFKKYLKLYWKYGIYTGNVAGRWKLFYDIYKVITWVYI